MNGIQSIKKDHREFEAMFKKLERGKDAREKQRIVRDLVREISKHAAAEEEILYPLVRRRVPKLEASILKSLEEHHIVKVTLSELEHLKGTDERFFAKVQVLIDEVRNHVAEEEEEVLPALERVLSDKEVNTLGDAIDSAKKVAPTRPHPLAPDTPPGNVVAGIGAALFDRARDVGREVLGRARRGNGRTERRAAPTPKRGRATTQRVSRATAR